MTAAWPPAEVRLDPNKRVLFLTKDLELIRKQLEEGLDLRMEDLTVDDLLDDINTDVMTPAWVCFRHRPADIALDAYAGLVDADGKRVFETRALIDGNFEAIVSGYRKGTGSSRETAAQCERWLFTRTLLVELATYPAGREGNSHRDDEKEDLTNQHDHRDRNGKAKGSPKAGPVKLRLALSVQIRECSTALVLL